MSKSYKKNSDKWGNEDDDRYERRRVKEMLNDILRGEDEDAYEAELYWEDKRPEREKVVKQPQQKWTRDTTKRSFDDV